MMIVLKKSDDNSDKTFDDGTMNERCLDILSTDLESDPEGFKNLCYYIKNKLYDYNKGMDIYIIPHEKTKEGLKEIVEDYTESIKEILNENGKI